MYVDQKVLTIIYNLDNQNEEIKQKIFQMYEDNLSELVFVALNNYFEDTSIDKPQSDVFDKMKSQLDDEDSVINYFEELIEEVAVTPQFQILFQKLQEKFNANLIEEQLKVIELKKKIELLEYISSLTTRLEDNLQVIQAALQDKDKLKAMAPATFPRREEV